MTEYNDPGRRHDDPYRELNDRMVSLEHTVSRMETDMNTLKLEQTHMSALFAARFSTLEKSQELTISKVDGIAAQISSMASEADKSPAGRALLNMINTHEDDATARTAAIKALEEWQNHVDGVLVLLKWMGASGVMALIWVALRAAGKVP